MIKSFSGSPDPLRNALVFFLGNVLPFEVKKLNFEDKGGAPWDFGRATHVAVGVRRRNGEHRNLLDARKLVNSTGKFERRYFVH